MTQFDDCTKCGVLKTEIEFLKQDRLEQWAIINVIKNRTNVILSGIASSCILLLIDIIIKTVK